MPWKWDHSSTKAEGEKKGAAKAGMASAHHIPPSSQLQSNLGNRGVQHLIQAAPQSGTKGVPAGQTKQAIPELSGGATLSGKAWTGPPGGVGRPLDPQTQQVLEQSFGQRLDQVRIRDDAAAQAYVRSRKASALTSGQQIFLRDKTENVAGGDLRLLAHEVAHTLQQRSEGSVGQGVDAARYRQLENQAWQAADQVVEGAPATVAVQSIGTMEQAAGEGEEIPLAVLSARNVALVSGLLTDDLAATLRSHPPTYDFVVRRLMAREADWLTDKLLEVWVDDDDEWAIIRSLRRWAYMPKVEGGNYLDDMLDAIRGYRYRFDYLVTESAWGNMLDKLYAELEDDRYEALVNLVDSFSVRYAGYRGRGGITRWSGVATAVMPERVRDRISSLNQRLAGRLTVPMTEAEVARINFLYATLRRQSLGLIDMPDIQISPTAEQEAAPAVAGAVAIPVGAILFLLKALLIAMILTIALMTIIAICDELERILDRPVPEAEPVPVPIPRAVPRAVPRAIPRERAKPEARRRRMPPVYPIYWPHWSGRGLAIQAPNPLYSIWLSKPLVRTTPPTRDWSLIETFRATNTVLTGQAVHHVTPLFLGGPDSLGNLAAIWISYHNAGHVALRFQPHLSFMGISPDLYSHPPGTPYIVAAIV